jgi:hypothetical protein
MRHNLPRKKVCINPGMVQIDEQPDHKTLHDEGEPSDDIP